MKSLLLFFLLSLCNISHAQIANQSITVYFDFNSSKLSPFELQKLSIFDNEDVSITEIEAHTDSSGSISYNKRLASQRLDAVLNHVSFNRSKAKIEGESKANTATNYSASKFRKVEIFYSESEASKGSNPTLNSAADDFLKSDETTVSIDLYIHFEPGTAVPLPQSFPEIKRLAEFLKENKTLNAFIHGHVCCAPDIGISERRAGFVYNYLIKNGIKQDRLQKMGHGNTQPKTFPEVTEEDRVSNRRVNVVFTKQ